MILFQQNTIFSSTMASHRDPCGPKNICFEIVIEFSQVFMSRSCYQLLQPCPPHTGTSAQITALTAPATETSMTCVILNESGDLGWRWILEKTQKSRWKRSSSSIEQIIMGPGKDPGPKTLRSDSQINFHLQEVKCSKVANS